MREKLPDAFLPRAVTATMQTTAMRASQPPKIDDVELP